MASKQQSVVSIGGHTLKLSNLDKVLYPETGTTKAEVIDYYMSIADVMLPHIADRPATRKRWVHGVGTADEPGEVFFQKNLGDSAPDWVLRREIQHSDHENSYPLVNDAATLAWLGQIAALEIHVPQWRFDAQGKRQNPDRLVLDLDPGDGVSLAECAEIAVLARGILRDMGLDPMPVTSGSKGIHLYAALDGKQSGDDVTEVAHELARALEAEHPDDIVSSMSRALRPGKVFIDWSQNREAKTTVAPYSLRGKLQPMVAAPRTWRELMSKNLRQLDFRETLRRVQERGDPLAGISSGKRPGQGDRLAHYRERRDASKTPEPIPDAIAASPGRRFVIQEHHARGHHFDFRLEHDGVLVSWALPRGMPGDAQNNRLAVQTEDHPVEYADFEGVIPRGEYGAGTVEIWDTGDYELEKWREDEVIVSLHGRAGGGLGAPTRVALIRTTPATDGKGASWLLHRMKAQTPDHEWSRHSAETSGAVADEMRQRGELAPMLATLAERAGLDDEDEWAIEMKWDGIRAIAVVDANAGTAELSSRNGIDLSRSYPELIEALLRAAAHTGHAVLDGEIVAPDSAGRPDFGRLQTRMGLTGEREVERAAQSVPVQFIVFDVLELDGVPLIESSYDERRSRLEHALAPTQKVVLPAAITVGLDAALDVSEDLGLEGVVAKRRDGPYKPGRRSTDWLKFKHLRTQEVVIGGWRPGNGARRDSIGSLLLGVPTDDGLRYVGRVGTGFSSKALDDARTSMAGRASTRSPFIDVPESVARDAHWVRPDLVAEVEFFEWTSTGQLRQPSWRGWRMDKSPSDVAREHPGSP
ncbi:ATP-dependent DNA ligase [Leifsonia sp. Root4]|uniref:ATP-dependent DNA ligase n=1 Tax=Leifsonia sp. Root4 TaxID=1736525 RepID=UPI0006F55A72|nr:ATP-dependent DNA ligase [Leifsonia sp. Root4]KQW06584.1 ATP-dependent DNA ligase [Leifsonia sp. Root4]